MIKIAPLAFALGGSVLLSAFPLQAAAQDEVVAEVVTTIPYSNGGVGREDRAAMRKEAHEYPLRMTFTEHKDGELVADVPVVVQDTRGETVFALPDAGPLLYVMLPDGKYRVSAEHAGTTETRNVTVDGKHGHDLYFHWSGRPSA